jgi:hypothetical protein
MLTNMQMEGKKKQETRRDLRTGHAHVTSLSLSSRPTLTARP